MTIEDYNKIAGTLTTENAPEVMKQILDGLKTDIAERDTFKSEIAERDKKIADLQQTNIKLFLQQTGKDPGLEEKPEPTPAEALQNLIDTIKKEN